MSEEWCEVSEEWRERFVLKGFCLAGEVLLHDYSRRTPVGERCQAPPHRDTPTHCRTHSLFGSRDSIVGGSRGPLNVNLILFDLCAVCRRSKSTLSFVRLHPLRINSIHVRRIDGFLVIVDVAHASCVSPCS